MSHNATKVFLCGVVILSAPLVVSAVNIDTVPVGNAGNAWDVQPQSLFGLVAYDYRIGKTEVTNAQYAEFLNAKAASDPVSLYNTSMGDRLGGITRSGASGSYTYATIAGRENKPVNFVDWYDAVRFANWLHNGQGSGDTESGAYTLLGGSRQPFNANTIIRSPDARWFLPKENEWYKAAYHKNDGVTGNYFDYPTASDTAPVAEAPPGGGNSANYAGVVGDLTDGGAYTASASAYGTFDQGGNVWEWNETSTSFANRGMRGAGSHVLTMSALSASSRRSEVPLREDFSVGFRVGTFVPEPSTFALAAFGFVALAVWGWRRRR